MKVSGLDHVLAGIKKRHINWVVGLFWGGPPSFVDDYEKIVQEEFVVMDTRVERWW